MSKEIRDAYNTISEDYLSKKEQPWVDFLTFTKEISVQPRFSVIDVGAGNGRNLNGVDNGFPIALELSFELLLGYNGPNGGQKVAGSLPHLPFRDGATDMVISIAVLHHFKEETQVIDAMKEMRRIGSQNTKYIFSVWRRWRTGYRKKLIQAIKNGEDIDPLINHMRPWYNSNRKVLTHRFYHYYSFKELYYQLQQAKFEILNVQYIGGRHDDANIFVEVTQQSKSNKS